MSAPKGSPLTEEQRSRLQTRFQRRLQSCVMACVADSYHEFSEAMLRGDTKLYEEAALHGREGVDMLIDVMRREIHRRYTAPALADMKADFEHRTNILRDQIKELRDRFFQPVDYYREELEKHDWYYRYSDQASTYNHWDDNRAQLLAKAVVHGEVFQKAYDEVGQRHQFLPVNWSTVENDTVVQHYVRTFKQSQEETCPQV